MREKRADYWRRLCPVKALTEQIPPSAAEGSDYIFPGTQNGAVQDSAMQTAHQLHGDPLQGTRERRAAPRGGAGPPPHGSPPASQTFRLYLHFVKPAFLKSLKWQALFPQISPFRNILKMEYSCIGSSQQKPSRLFSLTYPIAVLAQTDQIFQVAGWYKMGNP